MKKLISSALIVSALLMAPAKPGHASQSIAQDKSAAVVLAYYRIGEDEYPDSNLRREQWEAHLEEFLSGNYTILPLPQIVDSLKKNAALPSLTLAITFEGAYKSALKNAIPALLEHHIPFTIFYASDQADSNEGQYMNWQDLKDLSRHPEVSFGLLPAAYARLADEPEAEIRRQINKARQRHREMINHDAPFFSYPFGEYSLSYKKIAQEAGFDAAFGLQSGAAYANADYFILPRFTLTERFGNTERFDMIARALPLPVHDIEPQDPHLPLEKPALGFTVDDHLKPYLKNLSCFVSGQPQPAMEIIGTRVEVRPTDLAADDKFRINCTMPGPAPAPDEPQSWRWFGLLLVNKDSGEQPAATLPPDAPQ